jgi:SAM-dependent methyltransferase
MTASPTEESLQHYRNAWERKPGLQAVYRDIYRHMLDAAVPGRTLEIGGGSGNFKAMAPDMISTDIQHSPWLDLVCDAQQLPFGGNAFANVVAVDVLHHIENPLTFLIEVHRVLCPGGRLVLCEPGITPISGAFYRLFHREPVDMSIDPTATGAISARRNPYDSNQAIPTLLVGRFREAVARAVPGLRLQHVDWFSFLAYPLSGGFQPWSLLPGPMAGPLLAAEWRMRRLFGKLAAFRMLAVYEKTG